MACDGKQGVIDPRLGRRRRLTVDPVSYYFTKKASGCFYQVLLYDIQRGRLAEYSSEEDHLPVKSLGSGS